MRALFCQWLRLAALLAVSSVVARAQGTSTRQISESEMQAVVQAIEDEIYDYSYQLKYKDLTAERERARFVVYINPNLEKDGWTGQAIYKLMPHGEVIRWFSIQDNSLVFLWTRPEHGFSPTHPSMLTVYLEDESILQWKRTWEKQYFTVVFRPSPERIQQAVERQKKRNGYSYWESKHKPRKKKNKEPAAKRPGSIGASAGRPSHALLQRAGEGVPPGDPRRPAWGRGTPLRRYGPFEHLTLTPTRQGARL